MAQGAAELPEDHLFDHLLTVGRERRTAAARLEAMRTALTAQPAEPGRRRTC